jgi:tRNA1(Val) A37 N6-methylase TrmN6
VTPSPRRPAGWIAPGPKPRGSQGRAELEPAADEDLSYLCGDWRLFQKRRGHRWSLDDLVTAWVATREPARRALDLGCGLGSVLLMVAWKLPGAEVTGVEAQADRAAMGRRSIAYDGADDRCRIVDGDLRDVALDGCFDLVTGTPPYFPRGTGTESEKPHAAPCRFELRGGIEDYLAAATRVVAPGGRIVVCSSVLERDRVRAAAAKLPWREHWEIVPRDGKPPLLAVDVFAPGPRTDHVLVVRRSEGQWTPAFRAVRDAMGMPSRPP